METIGKNKEFESAAKALHQDWAPEKVHHLIKVVDDFVAAALAQRAGSGEAERILAAVESGMNAEQEEISQAAWREIESSVRAVLASEAQQKDPAVPENSMAILNCCIRGGNTNGNPDFLIKADNSQHVYLDGWVLVGPTSSLFEKVMAMTLVEAPMGVLVGKGGKPYETCMPCANPPQQPDSERDVPVVASKLSLQQVADRIDGRGVMSPTEFRRFLNGDGVEMYPYQITELANLFIQDSKRDAARYRWLRESMYWVNSANIFNIHGNCLLPEFLDKEIDDAMAAHHNETGGAK